MNVRPKGTYIDATFGRGGHSRALLARLDNTGRLLVLDRDPEAITVAEQLAASDPRVHVRHLPFSRIDEAARELGVQVDGILFDLGISSPQVDQASRGFSFRADGPLDMRMDPTCGVTAAEWINSAGEKEISDVLWQLGEERRSRQIAKRIVDTRRSEPITTTFQLARLVRSCVFSRNKRIDPATRTFQAIRLRINDELGELEQALKPAIDLLAIGGRLMVIAFHSLEDRFVKRAFRDIDQIRRDHERSHTPVSPAYRLIQRKAWQPGEAEIASNSRARSARLRILERVA